MVLHLPNLQQIQLLIYGGMIDVKRVEKTIALVNEMISFGLPLGLDSFLSISLKMQSRLLSYEVLS